MLAGHRLVEGEDSLLSSFSVVKFVLVCSADGFVEPKQASTSSVESSFTP